MAIVLNRGNPLQGIDRPYSSPNRFALAASILASAPLYPGEIALATDTGVEYRGLRMVAGAWGKNEKLANVAAATALWPDAANTGVPTGTVLTTYVGPQVVVINGTLIENKIIDGGIEIQAANVIIRNCRVVNASIHGITADTAVNLTVERCDIIGTGGTGVSTGILAGGTITANDVSGFALGMSLTGAATVKDNYIHDLHKDGVDVHYDGIAIFGGGGALIEHNTIYVPTQALGGATACIFLKNFFGQINNVTIKNNLLRGEPAYTFQFDGQTAGSTISNVSVVNNVMQTGIFGYYSVDVPPAATNITGSGNVDYLTGTTVPFPSVTSFPDAANTGPASGTVFTTFSGNFNTSSNGQIVEKLNITGQIIVRHPNVIIRDCIVNCTEFFGVSAVGGPLTNVKLLRTRIIGIGNAAAITPDGMPGLEISFCDISRTANGINVGDNALNIHDNYLHDLSGAGVDPHIDGIQGSGGFSALTIEHNTIISWDTSCIILQNEGAGFSGVVINNNRLIIDPVLGGAYCILCQDLDAGVGAVSNITITNNRMLKGNSGGQTYGFFHNVTALTWTGNVDDMTGVVINPDIG